MTLFLLEASPDPIGSYLALVVRRRADSYQPAARYHEELDFAAQVKASVDIVSVVGEYVRLKRVGATQSYTGLCPFHTEKTPSFRVHSNHQFYKCFGCGQGGDVFKFVQEIERVSFYEALKQLAERSGIPLPRRSEYADAETKLRAAIYRMHELAAEAFRASLLGPAGAEARAYLERRGVGPAESSEFGLGYAERSGQFLAKLLEQHDFTAEQREQSGLVLRREDGGFFDRFRNRLMFPIHNESGKPIGFGGRALGDDPPKYMNSPETPIYRKSYVLYNLHRAKEGVRQQDRVVLVEGYMDVIGVYAAGVREVVASCGTALTTQQVQTMKRHSGRIVVNFDPDAAGASATEKSLQILLEEGMHVRILELSGGLDPDEYCQQNGAGAYASALGEAKNYFYWLADRARSKYEMRTAEGRVAAFQFLLPAIQRLTDKIERSAIAGDVAGYLGVEAGLVLENFRKAATDRCERTLAPAAPEPVRPSERILLNLILNHENIREPLVQKLRKLGLVEHLTLRPIFQAVLALDSAGAPFGFAELDSRLEDADRAILTSIAFSGEAIGEDIALNEGMACIQKLERETREARIRAVKASIRDAERSGNLQEALRLNAELDRIVKSERPGDVQ